VRPMSARPMSARPRCSADGPIKEHVAGYKPKEAPDFSQAPSAVRSDPNRSSIHGGIFGATGAPPVEEGEGRMRSTSYARSDPNRSSVKGGIFG